MFFTVAYFPLELVAGRYSTDHNDVAFLFYITASFWAWFEYKNSGKKYWLPLIGLFSGSAVLVKWLVGLLIYVVWICTIAFNGKGNWKNLKLYIPLLTSLLVTFLVFIPWQIFIFYKYPTEANYEFLYNTKHFFEAVENHGGDSLFHFKALNDIYGRGLLVPSIYLAGIAVYLKNIKRIDYRIAILSAIVIVYSFYSIASTKMVSFCIIVTPFTFLGLASLIDAVLIFISSKIAFKKFEFIFSSAMILTVCFFLLNFSKIENNHTMRKPNDNWNRAAELAEMKFINELNLILKNEKYVIFNAAVRKNGHIPIMFYTHFIAYDFIPTEKQIEKIKLSAYKIAILNNVTLPKYIMENNEVLKLNLY